MLHLQLRANIQIHAQVSDNGQAANQNHREVMDLLQQVLTSRQEISEVARMAVEERLPVAERLMSDGQQVRTCTLWPITSVC